MESKKTSAMVTIGLIVASMLAMLTLMVALVPVKALLPPVTGGGGGGPMPPPACYYVCGGGQCFLDCH
jgi:hypothetical protein